jgi:hypothetical protein
LLAALEQQPAVYLDEILGVDATRSQRIALQRAAKVLEGKGVIGILPFWDAVRKKTVAASSSDKSAFPDIRATSVQDL